MPVPSPFLFVKIVAPKGATATWYPGTTAAVTTDVPVGLRAGYCYRMELSNLPEHPNMPIYPSIEVRGSLIIRDCLDVTKHPVPITLTEEDIGRIYDGSFVSKVYYLEDPQQALNVTTQPGEAVEMRASSEEEAIKEARQKGRIFAIVRAGERGYSPDELARSNVPGTILFAHAKSMPRPAAPPCMPYGNYLFDPLLGPTLPKEEIFFDGGDTKRPIGIVEGQKLGGVDASDTVIEFKTIKGKNFAVSNRVCLAVPRFMALRSEVYPSGYLGVRSPVANIQVEKYSAVALKVPAKAMNQEEQLKINSGAMRPSGMQSEMSLTMKTHLVGKAQAMYKVNGAKNFANLREAEDITIYPGCNLALQKRMVPPDPQLIGEEVTFFLKFHNPTPYDMTEAVITDSLTGRLEYLPGTQRASRPATFTATANEAGSLMLKWAIDGKILPGESGEISFKCRIR
jgi:hypothetical protein